MERSQATAAPRERDGDEHASAIRARLAELLGESPTGEIRRLSGGASRETYLWRCGLRGELVVQIEHGGKPSGEPPGQAELLTAAARAGVPVASVVAHGRDDPVLGAAWTLLEALAGTTDPEQVIGAVAASDAPKLIDSIAQALAAVHRMPAEPSLAPPIEEPVAQLRALYERLGEPHATFELAFEALGASVRRRDARTVVHGDFRMGNLMVAGERGDRCAGLGARHTPAIRSRTSAGCASPRGASPVPSCPPAAWQHARELLAAYERHCGCRGPDGGAAPVGAGRAPCAGV